LHTVLLISQRSESVDDYTENNVQEHNDYYREKRDIQHRSYPERLSVIALVADVAQDFADPTASCNPEFESRDEAI
jgi:hypothetical protein